MQHQENFKTKSKPPLQWLTTALSNCRKMLPYHSFLLLFNIYQFHSYLFSSFSYVFEKCNSCQQMFSCSIKTFGSQGATNVTCFVFAHTQCHWFQLIKCNPDCINFVKKIMPLKVFCKTKTNAKYQVLCTTQTHWFPVLNVNNSKR